MKPKRRKSTPVTPLNGPKPTGSEKSGPPPSKSESDSLKSPEQVTFEDLISDPIKRDLLFKFLSINKENVDKFKQEPQRKNGNQLLKKTHCESPTALCRRRALEKKNGGPNDSNSEKIVRSPSPQNPTVAFNQILEGVVIYVEVLYKDRDRSADFKPILAAMGATVVDKLTRGVTHVLFKGGSFVTYHKAAQLKVHLVSLLWLEAMKTRQVRVPEKNYPAIGTEGYDVNVSALCEDYEEMIEDEYRNSLAMTSSNINMKKVDNSPQSSMSSSNSNRSSVNIVLASQNCEVRSLISYANDKLPLNPLCRPVGHTNSDRLSDSASDDDSDCPVIDGYLNKRNEISMELTPNITAKFKTTSNAHNSLPYQNLTESNEERVSWSLLGGPKQPVRKRKSPQSFNIIENKRKSTEIESSSSSLSSSSLPIYRTRRSQRNLKALTQSSTSNSTNCDEKRRTRSSGTSESMPALRISTPTSPKTKDKRLMSAVGATRTTFSSESMPPLRISTQSETRTSTCNNDNRQSDKTKKHSSLQSESMPLLRISCDDDTTANKSETNENGGNCLSNNNPLTSVTSGGNSSNVSFKSCQCSPIDATVLDDILRVLDEANDEADKVNEEPAPAVTENATETRPRTIRKKKLYNLNAPVDEDVMTLEPADRASEKTPAISHTPTLITKNVHTFLKKQLKTKTKAKQNNRTNKTNEKPSSDPRKRTRRETIDENPKKCKRLSSESFESSKESRIKRRRSQRISQHSKQGYSELSSDANESSDDNVPLINRRSTFDFVQTPTTTRKPTRKTRKKTTTSIVFTRFHQTEMSPLTEAVKNLGGFMIERTVTKRTSHLIVKEVARTLNLMRAIARGCWIVRHEWLIRSVEAAKWLPEEDYELTNFSGAVQQCRKQREAFGSLYSMDIFEGCGLIYVGSNSEPHRSDLHELIELCKGKITCYTRNANISVGERVRDKSVVCVSEKWVLDSITHNKCKRFRKYLLENDD